MIYVALALPPRRDRGSGSIFFIAAILPLLFLTIGVALDLSLFYLARSGEQRALDNAVLLGAKHLPFRPSAEDTVRRYLQVYSKIESAAHGRGETALSVTSTNDQISATVQVESPLYLTSLVPGWSAITSLHFPLRSTARINPRDIAIFFDNSRYLAPAYGGGESWTDERGASTPGYFTDWIPSASRTAPDWPAAQLFQQNIAITPLARRIRTQQCFNPVYAAIKEGAIRLYDYLSSFSLNSVGVFSGPSTGGGIFMLRDLTRGGVGPSSEGRLELAAYPIVNDTTCLAIAESANNSSYQSWLASERQKQSASSNLANTNWSLPTNIAGSAQYHYAFPNYSEQLDQSRLGIGAINSPNRVTFPNGGIADYGNLSRLTLRQAVWARAVNPNQAVNIEDIFNSVGSALLSAPSRYGERGELVRGVRKTAYIILGDFPQTADGALEIGVPAPPPGGTTIRQRMIAALSNLDSQASASATKLFIYLAVVRHYSMMNGACSAMSCPEFHQQFDILDRFLENIDLNYPNLELKALRVPDPGSLAQDLVAHLPLTERTAILTD